MQTLAPFTSHAGCHAEVGNTGGKQCWLHRDMLVRMSGSCHEYTYVHVHALPMVRDVGPGVVSHWPSSGFPRISLAEGVHSIRFPSNGACCFVVVMFGVALFV